MTENPVPQTPPSSPAVCRALATFWTRRAELAKTPDEREAACRKALDALKEADDARP